MLGLGFVACKKSASTNEQKSEQNTQSSTQDSTKQSESTTSENTEMSLSGSYYAEKSRELLILDWKNGNVSKIMYAPGGSNTFEEVKVVSTSGSMSTMDYKFSFERKGKVYEVSVGMSPGGASLSVTEKGKSESTDFGQANKKTTTEDAKYGTLMFVREIYWMNKFSDEKTKVSLVAEDSQEGTADGQLMMTYKAADGTEENIMAQVDPKTHELLFESQKLGGKIKGKLDNQMYWVLNLYNATTNAKIAELSSAPSDTSDPSATGK